MGKEAKWGIAVLVGLTLVLCTVLALRLIYTRGKPLATLASAGDSAGATIAVATEEARRNPASPPPTILTASRQVPGGAGSREGQGWNKLPEPIIPSAASSGSPPPTYMPKGQQIRVERPLTLPPESVLGATPASEAGAIKMVAATVPAPSSAPSPVLTAPSGRASTASPLASPALPSDPVLPAGTPVSPPITTPSATSTAIVPPSAAINPVAPAPISPSSLPSPTASAGAAGVSPFPVVGATPPASSSDASNPLRDTRYPPLSSNTPTSPWPSRRDAALPPSMMPAPAAEPSPPPARAMAPAQREPDGSYKVQPGDNYWNIAQRLYGNGAYFKALAAHNRGKQPREDRLEPGSLIAAPTPGELQKLYPDLCPKPRRRQASPGRNALVSTSMAAGRRTYRVVEGDTLSDIAHYELGKRARWAEIYELNREQLGDDYNHLSPGTVLALPESNSPVPNVAERPTGTYRR